MRVIPREPGLKKYTINVLVNNRAYDKSVDIIYTAVKSCLYLANEKGEPCKSINFGKNYVGESKQMKLYLHNNTPQTSSIKTKLNLGVLENSKDALHRHRTPQEFGNELTEKLISVSPTQA